MTINVAVIGLGKMGLSHLAIINSIADFKVVAICDSSAMVGDVIEKYGRLRYFSSFDKVLQLDGLDAIVIATPTVAHEAMTRQALERGLHVFCEKPLTLSSAVSGELAALAQAKGLIAQVGYHNRFIGTFTEMKRLVATGALGRVTHSVAESCGPVVLRPAKATWRGKAGQGGGCLYDYAAHPLNLLNWYFGEPQSCGGALLKSGFSVEVEDEVYTTLRFREGITGQLTVNWSDPSVRKMSTRVSIWGENGKIFADRQEIQVFLTKVPSGLEGYGKGWTVKYITELTPPVSFYLRGEEYSAQLEAFGRAILDSGAPRENDFASSAETDKTIEMIRAAAARGDGDGAEASTPALAQAGRRGGVFARMMGR